MALTLGTLRTFCREIASPDSSGSTAEREFMVWINGAIQRVFSATGWDRILHQQKVTILPYETKTSLVTTQGSLSISLVGPDSFLPSASTKYLDDLWELHVSGETDEVFLLSAIGSSTTATLRAGDEWTSASATGQTCYFVKTAYALPNNAKSVERVQVLENKIEIPVLPHSEFDHIKQQAPTQTGIYPRYATFRRGKIEIYPHIGNGYCKVGISYRKGPTVLADADLDATEIDWDDEWRDLLQKAIVLEAAITQGNNSPIPYPVAKVEYERRLGDYLALDANRDVQTGPMGLQMPSAVPLWGIPADLTPVDFS